MSSLSLVTGTNVWLITFGVILTGFVLGEDEEYLVMDSPDVYMGSLRFACNRRIFIKKAHVTTLAPQEVFSPN